jgi:hypothetical protein
MFYAFGGQLQALSPGSLGRERRKPKLYLSRELSGRVWKS